METIYLLAFFFGVLDAIIEGGCELVSGNRDVRWGFWVYMTDSLRAMDMFSKGRRFAGRPLPAQPVTLPVQVGRIHFFESVNDRSIFGRSDDGEPSGGGRTVNMNQAATPAQIADARNRHCVSI